MGVWLGVPAAEVGVAVVVSGLASVSRRGRPDARRNPLRTVIALNAWNAIVVGSGYAFILVVQNAVIDRVTSPGTAGQEAASARLFLRVSGVAAAVDIALGLAIWLAIRYRRYWVARSNSGSVAS